MSGRGLVAGNVFDKYGSRNPLVRLMVDNFLRTMTTLVGDRPVRRLLDVGCGEGYVAHALARHVGARHVLAMDLSPEILREARAAYPHLSFAAASAARLPCADASFDLVVAAEVLEHLDDPAAALAELARVCAGHCLISVPREPLWRALNVARGKYLADWGNTPGHVQHFSARTLAGVLGARFEVERWAHPFPWLMALCRPR